MDEPMLRGKALAAAAQQLLPPCPGMEQTVLFFHLKDPLRSQRVSALSLGGPGLGSLCSGTDRG